MAGWMRWGLACRLLPLLWAASAGFAAPAASERLDLAPLVCQPGRPVHEEGFVGIGGIVQWVTLHGDDCRNPVILFVHGGPGNPMTPYAHPPYQAWQQAFTVVHWDQRGAGRTYGRQPVDPEGPGGQLTLDLLAADRVAVADAVSAHLRAPRLILFGGSWGSALAVHMAQRKPERFVAYVGTGQLVDQENVPAAYRKALDLARGAGDTATLGALEAMGPPPWTNPRHMGSLRRLTRVYEAKASVPTPPEWWVRAPAYATEQAMADDTRGEDFSWVQYVGWKGDDMLSTLNLPALGLDFRMPVFMVQGTEDLVTVPEVSRRYFESIRAPEKAYFLLQRTGHDPNPVMVEAQYRILLERVKPLLAASPAN